MSKFIRTTIASLRFARGRLSQREVSQATGIGQKTLSALETGLSKGVEFNTLTKLCGFFRCDVGDLLVLEDEPEDVSPSEHSFKKADELVARGLKAAMVAPSQTPEEVWAEFDAVRQRLQKTDGIPTKKRGSIRA